MAPPRLDVCKNGHPRTPENVTSSRGCRTCCNERGRIRDRARYEARRGPLKGRPNARKTHCPQGHPYTSDNTYIAPNGSRQCRACRQERQRAKSGRVYQGEHREYAEVVRLDPCSYCGGPGGTADHIVPFEDGGPNIWENLTGACARCNAGKRTKPLLMFMLERVA